MRKNVKALRLYTHTHTHTHTHTGSLMNNRKEVQN